MPENMVNKMQINLKTKLNSRVEAFIINIFINQSKNIDVSLSESFKSLDRASQTVIMTFVKENTFKGGDTKLLFNSTGDVKNIIINFSSTEKWNERHLRTTIRKIILVAKENKFSSLSFYLKDFVVPEVKPEQITKILTENIVTAHFDFSELFKEKPEDGWPEIKEVTILVPELSKTLTNALKEGAIIGEEVNQARLLSNSPAGEITPEGLAEAARKAGKKSGFSVTIFDEKKLKTLGMGAILGVGQGSEAKPRLITMEYRGGKQSEKPITLIGKGVTFDSGGINIKTTDGLTDMHLDMSGGASVIYTMSAIARLKLPVNVLGFVPAVENMVSGASYRPGDILKSYSGKTIEILNTDAEGRVILADAISYAKTKNPSVIIDFATLTGAALIALGQHASAIFSKNDTLIEFLSKIGEDSGDYVWPLPLWDEYEDSIKGTFGDVANTGKNRYGGAINGAMFLWQFAKPNLWAHVDIAPTMTSIDGEYLAKGSTGAGVRLGVELVKRWKEFKQD